MKEYYKKNKCVIWIVLAISVAVSICLAWMISAFMWIPFPTPWVKTEWSGFLGSYIGGIATLLAVVLTISYNNFERQEMENNTKSEELKRCALIVYYDFQFAFDDLKNLYKEYLDMREKYPKMSEKDIMNIMKEQVTQVYLDNNWIYNVAKMRELCNYSVCENLHDSEIAEIYRIYGYLATIDRWLTSSIYRDNVLLALESIVESVKNEVVIKRDIDILFDKIRKVASIQID